MNTNGDRAEVEPEDYGIHFQRLTDKALFATLISGNLILKSFLTTDMELWEKKLV